MPIIQQADIASGTRVAVWHISETAGELQQMLPEDFVDESAPLVFKLELNRLQWLGSRVLLSKLLPGGAVKLYKDEFGKLHVYDQPWNISVSHTGHYAAAMISTHNCGIDIEEINNRISRVAHKFMNDQEQNWATESMTQHLLWGAKETMYKIYQQKELDFRQHMSVENPGVSHFFEGRITKDAEPLVCNLGYLCIENCLMVWGLENNKLNL